ncbi:hypothetical protein SLEP1_g59519 [Rubroshorea leprosula]|uniref:Uncharacterized protein n=1 Tax=Rubroshorea leprosula TaxID=152421 RepID=A0AAV5MV29_9ROSI|nr:hypothetical protein SLEP1_g59519 [Rubroshorea leprosula]
MRSANYLWRGKRKKSRCVTLGRAPGQGDESGGERNCLRVQ